MKGASHEACKLSQKNIQNTSFQYHIVKTILINGGHVASPPIFFVKAIWEIVNAHHSLGSEHTSYIKVILQHGGDGAH